MPFGRFWLLVRALPALEARRRVNDTKAVILGAGAVMAGKDANLSRAMQQELKAAYLSE